MTTWMEVSTKLATMSSDFQIMGSRTPPTEAEIDEVAERLGVVFPFQYRELVGRFASFAVEAKASKWPPPKLYDVAPAWTFVRGFAVYAFGDEVPDFLSLEKATRAFREESTAPLVPFFRLSGSADFTCFTREGHLVEWRHDEPGTRAAPASDVYGLLLHHLEELEENMAEMKKLRATAAKRGESVAKNVKHVKNAKNVKNAKPPTALKAEKVRHVTKSKTAPSKKPATEAAKNRAEKPAKTPKIALAKKPSAKPAAKSASMSATSATKKTTKTTKKTKTRR